MNDRVRDLSMRKPAPASHAAPTGTTWSAPPAVGNQATIGGMQSPFPMLSHAQLQAIIAESERPIREWLKANTSRLHIRSLSSIVAEVYREVPKAAGQGRGTIEYLVKEWAASAGVTLAPEPIPPAPAGPSIADSSIVSSVKGAIETIVDGVGVERSHGYAKIKVGGPTIGLRGKGFEAAGSVSWSGGFAVETSYEGFHFSGSMEADKWEMSLTFPGEDYTPDLSRLSDVFGKGEKAMRAILAQTAGFERIEDIPEIAKAVSPHLEPVKEAVKAAQGAAATKAGVNFGIEASGPGPIPDPAGGPQGVKVLGVLTIRF
ncbi:hypothetical protein ABIE65_003344 [Constrictibacter sp. MBR-5]|jgi:hypothetical protein|uniref:hypothetical protein n=1 Tax=Constrictibacter sp. MBR-5 TaxID=3156467 RepID=UPI00339AD5B5